MGWWSDWMVRPKSLATALLTGLALGGTAAITAYFSGVGWTTLSQHAVWPIQSDLELLAATIDGDTTFSEGRRLGDTYPGVRARRVMKKALADLETNIPTAMGWGLLFSINLLLLPAVAQTSAAYLLRQRGDRPWQRLMYLMELSAPLAIILGGGGYLIYHRPGTGLAVVAFGVVVWLLVESNRRWSRRTRVAIYALVSIAGLIALGATFDLSFLFTHAIFGGGRGGNSAALYGVGAAVAGVAVVQRWPWWRYGVYAIWVAGWLSTFTGPGLTFPATAEQADASIRNDYAGMLLVLAVTMMGAAFFSRKSGKQWLASRAVKWAAPTSVARRKTLMKRSAIVVGLAAVVAALVLVPVIQRQIRRHRLIEAMDRSQPDSIPEIKSLVAAGAGITTRGHDNTVAMVAAFWNDAALMKQALDAGLDPDVKDPWGNTALHFATFAPGAEPTRLLLAAGAHVNAQNQRGETPLMGAVRNAQFEQIKLLLGAGAKVDMVSQK